MPTSHLDISNHKLYDDVMDATNWGLWNWVFTGFLAVVAGWIKYMSSRIDKVEDKQDKAHAAAKLDVQMQLSQLQQDHKSMLQDTKDMSHSFTDFREYIAQAYVTRVDFKEEVKEIKEVNLRTQMKIDQLLEATAQRRHTDK